MNARFAKAIRRSLWLALLALTIPGLRGQAGEAAIAVEVNTPQHSAQSPSNGLIANLESIAPSKKEPAPAAKKPVSDAPLRRKGVDYGGLLPGVSQKHRPRDLLQLFNPFAPAGLGAAERGGAPWYSYGGPWAPPRAFRDAKFYEPQGVTLISVGF